MALSIYLGCVVAPLLPPPLCESTDHKTQDLSSGVKEGSMISGGTNG
jgi:hypothetical protein